LYSRWVIVNIEAVQRDGSKATLRTANTVNANQLTPFYIVSHRVILFFPKA
jgi:hypothetical protein